MSMKESFLTSNSYSDDNDHHNAQVNSSLDTLDNGIDDKESNLSYSHKKNTILATVISYVCTTVGAGIISLPYAIQKAGWFGILLIVFVAMICTMTAHLLCRCMFAVPGQRLKSYEEIGAAALGPRGKWIVGFFQSITLYGVCTIFLIIIGGNMTTLVPALGLHVWVIIAGFVLLPFSWLKTIKEISVLAYFGLFASIIVGIIIMGTGLHAANTYSPSYTYFDLNGVSTAINIIVFSLGSHSVLPSQVNEMENASKNSPIFVVLAYLLISTIYTIVAGMGYAGWGNDTADNVLVNIDAKLADGNSVNSNTHIMNNIARIAITSHVLLAYPLPLNPVSLFIEAHLNFDKLSYYDELTRRIILRSCLVFGSMFIATVVPYFGDILSLVSALSVIVGAFVFPPLFYYLLYSRVRTIRVSELIGLVAIGLFGVIACVVGVYYALDGLITDIQHNPNPFDNFWG